MLRRPTRLRQRRRRQLSGEAKQPLSIAESNTAAIRQAQRKDRSNVQKKADASSEASWLPPIPVRLPKPLLRGQSTGDIQAWRLAGSLGRNSAVSLCRFPRDAFCRRIGPIRSFPETLHSYLLLGRRSGGSWAVAAAVLLAAAADSSARAPAEHICKCVVALVTGRTQRFDPWKLQIHIRRPMTYPIRSGPEL